MVAEEALEDACHDVYTDTQDEIIPNNMPDVPLVDTKTTENA